jgi:hypothetical protein
VPVGRVREIGERRTRDLHRARGVPAVRLHPHLEPSARSTAAYSAMMLCVGHSTARSAPEVGAPACVWRSSICVCAGSSSSAFRRRPTASARTLALLLFGLHRERHHFERLRLGVLALRRERDVLGPKSCGPKALTNAISAGCDRQFFTAAGTPPRSVRQRLEQPRIRALEPHDRLLEIPDHHGRHARHRELPQELELQRVRILELVHHQAVDPTLEGREYLRPPAQQLPGERDHVAVVDEPRLALGGLVLHQHFLSRREQRLDVPLRVRERPRVLGSAAAAAITASAQPS